MSFLSRNTQRENSRAVDAALVTGREAGKGASESTAGVLMIVAAVLLVLSWVMLFPRAEAFELYKTFQTPEVFLDEVFSNAPPAPQVLNLDSGDQAEIKSVFGRAFPQQRVRYWADGERTVWIFDDIGKEGYVPTTCGFVVKNAAVEKAKVLIYRESRGEQVAEPSFLDQLAGAKAAGNELDVDVDNITGATLSVQMMERMARTALTLDALTKT